MRPFVAQRVYTWAASVPDPVQARMLIRTQRRTLSIKPTGGKAMRTSMYVLVASLAVAGSAAAACGAQDSRAIAKKDEPAETQHSFETGWSEFDSPQGDGQETNPGPYRSRSPGPTRRRPPPPRYLRHHHPPPPPPRHRRPSPSWQSGATCWPSPPRPRPRHPGS